MSNSSQPAVHPDNAGVGIRSFGVTFPNGHTIFPHQVVPPRSEEWHQLIYATRGVMTVRTDPCAWLVPPHRAVWIPAGIRSRIEMTGEVALRMLYVRARLLQLDLLARAPLGCGVVNVPPLLRELIVRTNLIGALDFRVPEQNRLIGVILDELKLLRAVPLQLPLPRDPRAMQFADLARTGPDGRVPIEKMVRQCGASRRTMERLFHAETRMTLGQWLRREKLLLAVGRLAAAEPVQNVALELGYNSASAFIAMFHRELGETPTQYFKA